MSSNPYAIPVEALHLGATLPKPPEPGASSSGLTLEDLTRQRLVFITAESRQATTTSRIRIVIESSLRWILPTAES
jgi:hypothetical protein